MTLWTSPAVSGFGCRAGSLAQAARSRDERTRKRMGSAYTIQLKSAMQALDRALRLRLVDQAGDLDFGGRDELDVDLLGRQELEHLRSDAGVVLHSHAHDARLGERLL